MEVEGVVGDVGVVRVVGDVGVVGGRDVHVLFR